VPHDCHVCGRILKFPTVEPSENSQPRAIDTNVLYAGYSAGACVLSPSLEGIHI
jgi:hypothetical protein